MMGVLIAIAYAIGYIMAWPVQAIYFRKRVYYEDKKTTSRWIKGPALIVSNHKNLMDYAMHMFLFPFHKLYCLMGELIYSHGKVLSFLLTILGGIKVDRGAYNFDFIDKAMKLFDKKKLLIVYPEARVATTDKLLPFHPTYILIALKSGVPIIPIYNDGHYRFKQRCHTVIGKAIQLREYCDTDNPTKGQIEYLNNLVKSKIKELEKLCKEKVNCDRYNHGIRLKYFIRDMGRILAFSMNVHFRVKAINKGKHKKNLKIKKGGVIVANHVSFADPLVLLCAFWRRRVYILAAEVVFDGHPVRAWLLKKLGCIRIDRNIHDFDAIQKCIDVVKAGNVLIVFPGGRIETESTLNEFKGGASLIACQANAPVYPVYMERRRGKLKRNRIVLGETIDVPTIRTSNRINAGDLDMISNRIVNSIKNLEGQLK